MALGLLSEIFFGFISKSINNASGKLDNYVFYRIVGLKEKYIIQCINKNATFEAEIDEIIFDINILHGLHPIQACYIGMEYAKYLKKIDTQKELKNKYHKKFQENFLCRYGLYSLCYQNRKGEVCFVDRTTCEEFIMEPNDIALSKELIQEFDASQAFYIGLLAGLKATTKHPKALDSLKKFHLTLVK